MSFGAFDFNPSHRPGGTGFGGQGVSRIAFPELWMYEARREMRMHAENVHHPDSVAERGRREQAKRYDAMKRELAAKRAAASDPHASLPPATDDED